MTKERTAALAATRQIHVSMVRVGVGQPLALGSVVRIFAPRRASGYLPEEVATMVDEAARTTRDLHHAPTLIVLPAGVGRIADLQICSDWWTVEGRKQVPEAVRSWVKSFASHLPARHPPVVLGLDGAVKFLEWGHCVAAVQLAVVVIGRTLRHITWKSKPANSYESGVIEIDWDAAHERPSANALARHRPVGVINGSPVLLLLCHDVVAFSARSLVASSVDGWAATIREQYDQVIGAVHAPAFAVNLIHKLPRRGSSRMVTSPCFQNSHKALRDEHGVPVIAVAGTNPDCSARSFDGLHQLLACDFRHVDVRIGVRRMTRR